MKLYFTPGACSLAPHILLEALGLGYKPVQVDLKKHTYDGGDFYRVNPKGSVPVLGLDGGEVLTENAVILQYLADQKPEGGMLPKPGTMARYRALEWLNFIATEVHKAFGPLFRPDTPESFKGAVRETIGKRFGYVAQQLGEKPFLTGDRFAAPDAYFFTMLTWAPGMDINLKSWPTLQAYFERVKGLPFVRKTLNEEGLQTH